MSGSEHICRLLKSLHVKTQLERGFQNETRQFHLSPPAMTSLLLPGSQRSSPRQSNFPKNIHYKFILLLKQLTSIHFGSHSKRQETPSKTYQPGNNVRRGKRQVFRHQRGCKQANSSASLSKLLYLVVKCEHTRNPTVHRKTVINRVEEQLFMSQHIKNGGVAVTNKGFWTVSPQRNSCCCTCLYSW